MPVFKATNAPIPNPVFGRMLQLPIAAPEQSGRVLNTGEIPDTRYALIEPGYALNDAPDQTILAQSTADEFKLQAKNLGFSPSDYENKILVSPRVPPCQHQVWIEVDLVVPDTLGPDDKPLWWCKLSGKALEKFYTVDVKANPATLTHAHTKTDPCYNMMTGKPC